MRFIADDNVPLPSIRLLSAAGHDVAAVALESPGISDETVMDRVVREKRILLTFDRDYGSVPYEQGSPPPEGIIYFRFVAWSTLTAAATRRSS